MKDHLNQYWHTAMAPRHRMISPYSTLIKKYTLPSANSYHERSSSDRSYAERARRTFKSFWIRLRAFRHHPTPALWPPTAFSLQPRLVKKSAATDQPLLVPFNQP